ncbi:DinB family protein [Hymenobacter sp. H14-R3]|uniref:DinB family protein n=1 Tax=Hymenobacter sp. H14-R3 TaxID=3046308 RepID=UPI0024B8A059|nr:DinB family protein [Hymenobacter sp. H14-R3]MDJ0364621.1 DinB family protein [Hymenobacter sp. H14-R3]
MKDPTRAALVAELTALLAGGNAHVPFEQAVADLPAPLRNQVVPSLPYTIWQLVEHVRIAQHDIVEFCVDPAHVSPEWPAGYWPSPTPGADEAGWQAALQQIEADQQRFIELLEDPATDLLAPLPHGTGQSLLREALLIGDHAAYHTGEIILVRRLLGAW